MTRGMRWDKVPRKTVFAPVKLPKNRVRDAHAFKSRFGGKCWTCQKSIKPGQMIRGIPGSEGSYRHAVC